MQTTPYFSAIPIRTVPFRGTDSIIHFHILLQSMLTGKEFQATMPKRHTVPQLETARGMLFMSKSGV